MHKPGHDTRTRILEAAYELFYRHGFARVSVDAIADAAGVTKRTLYYHFDSKDTVAGAVLDEQRDFALRRIETWTSGRSKNPQKFVDGIFDALAGWASQPKWLGSGFTRIAMELADLPGHPARRAASRHKAEIEAHLTEQLQDLGIAGAKSTARQLTLVLEGALAMTLIHGDPAYIAEAKILARLMVNRR